MMRTAHRILPIVFAVACLAALNVIEARKPGNSGGGGGIVNPAWVVTNGANIELLSSDGLTSQKLVGGGKADRFCPAWSPDGHWITYLESNRQGFQIRIMQADGTSNQAVATFDPAASDSPVHFDGLQWVPGENDRIMYVGLDRGVFLLSSITGVSEAIVWDDGTPLLAQNPALGPDLAPEMPGYQGPIAYVATNPADTDPDSKADIFVALVNETAAGWVLDATSLDVLAINGSQQVPAWSPSGTEIAFVGQKGTLLRTVPVSIDSLGVQIHGDQVSTLDLISNGFFEGRLAWSPDDRFIAYNRSSGSAPGGGWNMDIFVVASDGDGLPLQVTNNDAATNSTRYQNPQWNPLWIDF